MSEGPGASGDGPPPEARPDAARPDAARPHAVRPHAARPDAARRRPDGADDATVEAVGKASEALEWVARARGRLYDFHQMMGHADLQMGEAVELLERAGHHELARRLRQQVVGRNVVPGRWTYHLIEEFEDTYWRVARDAVRTLEDELMDGQRHVHEAEMRAHRRADGPTDDL